MKNMMSGIIERSNIKMQKLGIPTTRLEKSFKLSWIRVKKSMK